jgi:hypothetical protein
MLHLPESEKSLQCAQRRMPGIRHCARWIAKEEDAGKLRRSVSEGIGQIGVWFFMTPGFDCLSHIPGRSLPSADAAPEAAACQIRRPASVIQG